MSQAGSPWTLTGSGFSVACLHRLDGVRCLVPPHFDIQTVFPGRTLGGFYGLHYDDSPIGPYDELLVFPALVAYGDKVGCYVSHSYVNNERAVQGGLENWRSPREFRRIETQFDESRWMFELYDAGAIMFSAHGRAVAPAFPFHFSVPFIDDSGGQVVWYSGLFDTQIQFSTARLRIEPCSSLGPLKGARRLLSVSFKSLHVVVGNPSVVHAAPTRHPAYATPAISATGGTDLGLGMVDLAGWPTRDERGRVAG